MLCADCRRKWEAADKVRDIKGYLVYCNSVGLKCAGCDCMLEGVDYLCSDCRSRLYNRRESTVVRS